MIRQKLFNDSLLGKSSSFFAIRISTILAVLAIFALLSHRLTQYEYGRFVNFYIFLNILVVIANLGANAIAFSFTPAQLILFYNKISTKYKLYYISFLIIIGCIFYGYLVYSDTLTHNLLIGISVVLLFVVYALTFLLENILLLFKRLMFQYFLSFFGAIFWIIISYVAISGQTFNLALFIQLCLVITFIKCLLLVNLFIRSYHDTLPDITQALPIANIKKLWIHLGIYEMFQLVYRYLDKMIIVLIASKETAAVYFNGRIEIPFIATLLSSLKSASLVAVSKFPANRNQNLATSYSSSKILSTFTFAAISFFFVYRYDIFHFVFSDKYLSSVPIFTLALFILPSQYCLTITFIFQNHNRADIINKGALVDLLVTLILIIPFYQWQGAIGLVAAFLISSYCTAFYYIFQALKLLKAKISELLPLRNWLLKILAFALLGFVLYRISLLISISLVNIALGFVSISLLAIVWIAVENKNSKSQLI